MEKKLISVIIPVYNPGRHFKKCIESIINQTYRKLEIILIDDGSTDESPALCDKYAEEDNRIICVHQANNGVSSARNRGLELAHGDFYHFPDSDDYLDLDTYEYLINLIEEKDCGAVAFEHFVTYENSEIEHCMADEKYGLADTEKALINLTTGSQFCWNKLYKAKLIQDLRFIEDIYRGEDTLFAAQAFLKTKNVWFDKRPLYHYVQSEESACRGVFRPSQLSVLKTYDKYNELYKDRFPLAWEYFLIYMQEVLVSLYYDLWSDVNSKQYKQERKQVKTTTNKYYKEIKKSRLTTKKQRVKFRFFKTSLTVFCVTHKLLHKL